MEITPRLREIRDRWMAELGVESAAYINGGYCSDWASDAAATVGGEVAWVNVGGVIDRHNGAHAILSLDGRYYDAERCTGVDDPAELPWVARGGCTGLESDDGSIIFPA